MSIVMGLDQHRGQITGEWIDTDTGEVQRTRVVPADRAAVRRFLERFRGRELEVALEATTGWRFVVEELRRVGASVHLAEPAETAGLRGPKKRAKGDRADARHLRELLMIGRLPESWIPPDHILDLRARVRLRHTLSEQRSEWQQRIQATLYHHGCPQRRQLMVGDGREWLAAQPLPADRTRAGHGRAGDDRLARARRSRRWTRSCAPMRAGRPGCKALMAHYGIGELTAVTILAELGDCTRFSSSRQAVRYAGLDITVYQSDQRRAPGHISRQGPPALRWALYEAAQVARRGERSPDREYYLERQGADRRQPRVPVGRAQAAQAQLPHAARARRGGTRTRMTLPGARQAPPHTDAPRPAPGMLLPPRPRGRPRKTERPQRFPQRDHPITHHVAGPGANPRVADRSKAGRPRAQDRRPTNRAHAPPAHTAVQPRQPRTTRLTCGPYRRLRLLRGWPRRRRADGAVLAGRALCGLHGSSFR